MDICFQGFRFCLSYDLKSEALFMHLVFVIAQSFMDYRLKCAILLSADSERVAGR